MVGDNWKLAKALVRAKIEAPLAEDFWKGGGHAWKSRKSMPEICFPEQIDWYQLLDGPMKSKMAAFSVEIELSPVPSQC